MQYNGKQKKYSHCKKKNLVKYYMRKIKIMKNMETQIKFININIKSKGKNWLALRNLIAI